MVGDGRDISMSPICETSSLPRLNRNGLGSGAFDLPKVSTGRTWSSFSVPLLGGFSLYGPYGSQLLALSKRISSLGLTGRSGSIRIPSRRETSAGQVVCRRRLLEVFAEPPRLFLAPEEARRLELVDPPLVLRGLRVTGRSVAGILRG